MTTISVVTDSASDLPAEVVDKLGITVVPLSIRFGTDEYVDGADLSVEEFWARCASSETLPETAAPAPGAFEQAFRAAADRGAPGVVCVILSGELSATIQSARLGAEAVAELIPVRVIDSRSVSMGIGMMAILAAEAAQQGKGIDEVAELVEDLVGRSGVLAALDTLDNLKKGGRIGAAQALIGSMLSFKPIIAVDEGAVEPVGRQRTRTRALNHLLEQVQAQGPIERLAVMHAMAPDADEFVARVATLYPDHEIVVGNIGAVIGAHAGPGTVGVTWIGAA